MARTWQDVVDLGDGTIPSSTETEEPQRGGLFRRLRESLSASRQALQAELSASLFEQLDDQTWERLEEALILADVGVKTTADVVQRLEREVEAGEISGGEELRDRLVEMLAEVAATDGARIDLTERPAVVMI